MIINPNPVVEERWRMWICKLLLVTDEDQRIYHRGTILVSFISAVSRPSPLQCWCCTSTAATYCVCVQSILERTLILKIICLDFFFLFALNTFMTTLILSFFCLFFCCFLVFSSLYSCYFLRDRSSSMVDDEWDECSRAENGQWSWSIAIQFNILINVDWEIDDFSWLLVLVGW